MKEFHRARLQRTLARFEQRQTLDVGSADASFEAGFAELAERLIAPLMREIAAELEACGHAPELATTPREDGRGCIELALGLRGGRGTRNVVGFAVIRRGERPLEVQAYLVVNPPPFDLDRFVQLADLRPEVVERILLEAVEHIVASNAP